MIEFVGYATGQGGTVASFNVSLTSLTGGIGSAAVAGDFVVVASGWTATGSAPEGSPGVTTSGYANAHASLWANDVFDANFIVQYKRMGATPDSSVTVTSLNSASHQSVAVAMVFRGVDPTMPLDGVAVVTATGIDGSQANPPSITPNTAGAWVLGCTLMALDNAYVASANPKPPAGDYTYLGYIEGSGTVSGTQCGVAVKTNWTSGAYDQGAWTGHTDDAFSSWAASALVLKPDPTYVGSSGRRPVVFVCC